MAKVDVSILCEFECPVCAEYMHPPIRQCVVGHSICERCYDQIENCPTCRSAKGNCRSYALESLHSKLRFPCRNKSLGCKIELGGSLIQKHEEICEHGPLACPLRVINNCPWRGYLHETFHHCLEEHSHNTFDAPVQELACKDLIRESGASSKSLYHIMIKAYEELFKVVLNIDFGTGIMKWGVVHMKSRNAKQAAKYGFAVEFKNSFYHKIVLKAPCLHLVPNEDLYSFKRCIVTHCDMLRGYCKGSDLYYLIRINKFSSR